MTQCCNHNTIESVTGDDDTIVMVMMGELSCVSSRRQLITSSVFTGGVALLASCLTINWTFLVSWCESSKCYTHVIKTSIWWSISVIMIMVSQLCINITYLSSHDTALISPRRMFCLYKLNKNSANCIITSEHSSQLENTQISSYFYTTVTSSHALIMSEPFSFIGNLHIHMLDCINWGGKKMPPITF